MVEIERPPTDTQQRLLKDMFASENIHNNSPSKEELREQEKKS